MDQVSYSGTQVVLLRIGEPCDSLVDRPGRNKGMNQTDQLEVVGR